MARTNLENIIPIYRIGDGYVIAKDGSVTVGFILTLPEYDTLSKAVSETTARGTECGCIRNWKLRSKILTKDILSTNRILSIMHRRIYRTTTTTSRKLITACTWEAVALEQIIHIHNQTKKHFDTKRLFGRGDRQNSKCHKTLQSCALSILPKAHGRQGLVRISPGLLLHAGTMRPRPLVSRSKIRKLQDGRHRSSRRSAHQITSG